MKSRQYKISTRMIIVFSIIFVLSLVSSTTAIWRLKSVAESFSAVMDKPMLKYQMANNWYSNSNGAISRTTVISKSSDTTLQKSFEEEAKKTTQSSTEYQNKIKELINSPEEQALYDKIAVVRAGYLESRKVVDKLKSDGKMQEADDHYNKVYLPNAVSYAQALYNLVELERKNMIDSASVAEKTYQTGKNIVIVLTLVTLIVGIFLSYLLTRNISKEIGGEVSYAVEMTKLITSGNLSQKINFKENDKTSFLYNLCQMRLSIAAIVKDVREGATSIASASSEIAAGNQDLSGRTEQQAASLEETSSAMDELSSTVKQNADNASFAQQLVQSTVTSANNGGQVVGEVIDTMALIKDSSKKVADITSVIDSIAFQTNILALNAAVEAARAGEQGRGFAVVASEVRNLAQRSAQAAKEIKGLINTSMETVEKGVTLVNKAGTAINEVVVNVTSVSDIVSEISSASKEQSIGINEVAKAVVHMDGATQQNAALVEEAAAAAQMLQDQTEHLSGLVNKFIL